MARKKTTREPDGRSSIYFGTDGYWHGRVTMGLKDDGQPDRRHVMRKGEGAYDAVVAAVQELERQRAEGTASQAGSKRQTAEEWFTHWVENIAAPTVRYKTIEGYRNDVYKHIIPRLRAHKMDRLQHEPERFEKIYASMTEQDYKPNTVHHVHTTVRVSLREAWKRKVITERVFELIKGPIVEEEEIEPFDLDETRALIAAALRRRNGVRYILGLVIGTRKGETLGFRWKWLNKKTKVLRVRIQRQRHTYRHGCADPVVCAAERHKTKPCRQPCKLHERCPPPCAQGCVKHAMHCPERKGGVVDVPVKSRKGVRGVRLPDQLFALLIAHEEVQNREREAAGDLWHDSDFMFAQPNGKPIDPRTDHDEWKALLAEAGVRDARLHDARHTAATILLLLGVDPRAAQEILGWSSSKLAERYMHVLAALREDIAARVGNLLWAPE